MRSWAYPPPARRVAWRHAATCRATHDTLALGMGPGLAPIQPGVTDQPGCPRCSFRGRRCRHVRPLRWRHCCSVPIWPAPRTRRFGQRLYQDKADCQFCHGVNGDGRGDPRSPGKAPDLHKTRLDREQLVEVIACGRPGSEMPHFDKYAYEAKDCYGLSAEEPRQEHTARSALDQPEQTRNRARLPTSFSRPSWGSERARADRVLLSDRAAISMRSLSRAGGRSQ